MSVEPALEQGAPVSYPHPWLVVISVAFGSTAALASSIGLINFLMPRMMAELGADIQSIQWVQTSFLMTMVVLMPAVGWMGAAIGPKRLYLVSMALFSAGTVLCTLAWDMPSMIVFRVLQSVGASFFFPMGVPYIFDAFAPRRRGAVLGVSALINSLGSLGGTIFASHLADVLGWRWGFYYLLPLSGIGLILGLFVLKDRPESPAGRFDLPGFLSLAAALISFILLISRRSGEPLITGENLFLLSVCISATLVFIVAEKHSAAPFVNLSIYRHIAYAAGSVLSFMVPATAVAVSFLLPIYLQRLLGYSILQTALLRLPMGLALAVVTPLSGWLSDRMDARILMLGGALGYTGSLYAFSQISLYTSGTTLALILALMGITSTVLFLPMTNAMYSSLPQDMVRLGSGLSALLRQLGRSVGTAAISAIFAHRLVVRFVGLSEDVTMSSTGVRFNLEQISARLHNLGARTPDLTAISLLQKRLWAEASVAAFADCYLVMAGCFVLALVP
ncbi:MAG: DHA2 family efflux MFS transporter permease subunit, partial [bacterium]|nr:DHA2 family efflux MFS transporter permease subunit [bacterium]